MKKTILGIAAIAMAITSCSKATEGVSVNNQETPVGFGMYTSKSTKGGITNNAAIQASGAGFGILAYYTGQSDIATVAGATQPNFMYNQKVEYSSASSVAWGYNPIKYWPNTAGDKITFYAYAPYNASGIVLSANNVAGYPSINFTVAEDAARMVDLVTDNTRINQTKTSTEVAFKLKHILSRVTMAAKPATDIDAATKVVLTSVTINESSLDKTAKYLFQNNTWDYTNGEKISTLNIQNVLNLKDAKIGNYVAAKAIVLDNSVATTLFKEKEVGNPEYLFLIPAQANKSELVEVVLNYDIVTTDAALAKGYSVTSTTTTVKLPANSLLQGKAYKYTFSIGLTEVKVSTTVEDWANEE